MPKHKSSICPKHAVGHCSEQMHGRTDGLTKNLLLTLICFLTLSNAREKSQKDHPSKGKS